MVSTVTLAEVRRWDPQGLDIAARALVAARDGVEELRSRLRAARPDEARWQGVAAERARAAHDARDGQLRAMADRLGEVVPVFTGAADATGELLEELRHWDGVAAETGYTISRDGAVADTADHSDGTGAESAAEAEDRDAGAVQIRTGLGRVMERAAQIDAAILTAVQDGLAAPGSGPVRPTPSVPEPVAGPGSVRGFSGRDFMLDLPTTFPGHEPVAPSAPTLRAHPGTAPSSAAASEATTPHPPPSAAGPATDGAIRSAWAQSDVAAAAGFGPAAVAGDAAHREVATLQAWAAGDAGPGTVVRPPDPQTDRHDSLWRIAERELGDGARWPEIFALNRGDPQPGGRHFEQPDLVFPGEHLRLPTSTPAGPPAARPDSADGTDSADRSRPRATPDPHPGSPTPEQPPSPTSDPSPTATPHPTDPIPTTTLAVPTDLTPTSPSVSTTSSSPSSTVGEPGSGSASPGSAGPGVSIGPEVFVGAGLGVALVAGLLWARRGRRTGPPARTSSGDGGTTTTGPGGPALQPGPGSVTDPALAVGGRSGAGVAAGRGPQAGQARVDAPRRPALSATPTVPVPRPASGAAAAAAAEKGWSTRLPVGAREGREIAFDLAAVSGLGIDGAGAAAAVRGLAVNALGVNLVTATPGDAPPPVTVVITGEDLGDLLDQHGLPADVPAGLQVVDTLEDVLDVAEATIHARITTTDDGGGVGGDPMAGSTLVVVTATPPQALTARLQAVLVTGQACGVVGVVWGEWRGGASVHADGDGLVWAADRGPGDGLRGVRLYGLGAAEVPDLLALLDSVEPGTPAPPAALSGTLPAPTPQPPSAPTTAPVTASTAAAYAGRTGGRADNTTETTTPTRPTPPADRETPGDADPGRVAAVDRGDRPSWTAEDNAARIAAALDPDTPAAALRAPTVQAPVAAPDPVLAPVESPTEASDDPVGHTEQPAAPPEPGGGSTGAAAGQDAADCDPVSAAAPPAAAPGDVEDAAEPRSGSGSPITLRILGRPALLVERPTASTDSTGGGVPDADSVKHGERDARVAGVDAPGAVEVTATLSARMRDLLVYLAVHPDGVRRDTAVAELWPDTGRHRPGNNLSSLISRLRAAVRAALAATPGTAPSAGPDSEHADRVGPIVLVEGDRYRLDDTHIAVDYWSFLTDAAATGAASPSPTPRAAVDDAVLARWQRAQELYRGLLADGVDHAWILSVREATRRTFLSVTARLVRHHVASDPAAALAILETVRNLEPTNQSVYRDIMALQLRLGDNDAAAATLRLLENQLADVEESLDDATRTLARAILE